MLVASPVDVGKLCTAIRSSREVLRAPRQWRFDIAKQVAGDRFAGGGADARIKLNLLALYHDTFSNLLVANEPRYLLTNPDLPNRAAVRVEQDWLNEQAERMELGNTGRAVVGDALMGTGICYCALASPCEAAMLAWGITAGEPIAMPIDFDDYVYGTAARTFATTEFEGHRFRCRLDVAKKLYKAKMVEGSDDAVPTYNDEGDLRINQIMVGNSQVEEFEEHVDLWQIYLPHHKLIVVLADKDILEGGRGGKSKALWKHPWIGPPWGPYVKLGFGRVPGAAIAKAPMMDLYEIHMDVNNIRRKASRTLQNLKENMIYRRSQSKDAEEIQSKNHLDWCAVDDPDSIKSISLGGQLIQPLLAASAEHQATFNFLGGNINVLAGRGTESETVGQEKILNRNAGSGVQAMQGRVEKFMTQVGHSMLWFAHYHPELVMESFYQPPGSKGTNRKLYPIGDRRGPARNFVFERSKFRLDPFSIRHKSPEQRLALIGTMVDKLTPMLPILAAQNIQMDAKELIDIFAEYGDEPAIRKLYTVMAKQQGDGKPDGGVSHERTLSPSTNREYTRTSVSEGGEDGAAQQVAEMSPDDFSTGQEAA